MGDKATHKKGTKAQPNELFGNEALHILGCISDIAEQHTHPVPKECPQRKTLLFPLRAFTQS